MLDLMVFFLQKKPNKKKGILDLSNVFRIQSIKGIEFFPQLEELNCSHLNSLKELDISKNIGLKSLYCDWIRISDLDISNNPNLELLSCPVNNIQSLDLSNNTKLKTLICRSNAIRELDVSQNPELEILDCQANNISTLNLEHNPNLVALICTGNSIDHLNVKPLSKLEKLYCSYNKIHTLDLSFNLNLKELECHSCDLTNLDVSLLSKLTVLLCSRNNLTNIDVQYNPLLIELDCSDNNLKYLNISANPAISFLDCSSNYLSALMLNVNTELKILLCANNLILSLDLSEQQSLLELDCSLNSMTNLDLSKNMNINKLNCSQNRLKSINIQNLLNLKEFQCQDLRLTELNVSNNELLQKLNCSNNLISYLDLSNLKELKEVKLNQNKLTALPKIHINDQLSIVDIRYNNITKESCPFIQELLNHIGYARFSDFITDEIILENGFAFEPQYGMNESLCEEYISNENINTPDNFPDPKFRQYVERYMEVNPGGEFTSAQAALKTEQLNTSQSNSLKGIEFFTGLEDLYYDGHKKMSTIDVSRNIALTRLIIRHSLIKHLDTTNNQILDYLSCSDNLIQSLDLSKNTLLSSLLCSENQISELNVENLSQLNLLVCDNNLISKLNLLKNTNLKQLYCEYNFLTDISSFLNLPSLTKTRIQNNLLDCDDFDEVLQLLNIVGEPVYNERIPGRVVYQSGLIFSPQRQLDPYNCDQVVQFTPTPTPTIPIHLPTPTPPSNQSNSPYSLQIVVDVPVYVLQNSYHKVVMSYNNNNPNYSNWDMTYSGNIPIAGSGRHNNVVYFILPTQELGNWFILASLTDGELSQTLRFNYTVVTELPTPTPTPHNWSIPTPTIKPTLPPSPIQINTREYFPDDNFRRAVEYFMRIGVYPLGFTAEQAAAKTGFLDCSGAEIYSIQGIEYLPNITGLNVGDNHLKSIDVTNNIRLKELLCYSNQLINLDISNNAELEYLSCFNNQLTHLNLTNNFVLKKLFCFSNHLNMISFAHTDLLETILCDDNKLHTLSNFTQFHNLKKLDLRNNNFECDDIREIQMLSDQLGGWNPVDGNGIMVLPQNTVSTFDCPSVVKSWNIH